MLTAVLVIAGILIAVLVVAGLILVSIACGVWFGDRVTTTTPAPDDPTRTPAAPGRQSTTARP